ncbi:MAG: hypothetical protein KF729_08210 [Sandaracinaceae bacterium]|nr:hypothetical protein [Sandaracinaceae bacterium]
MRALAVLVAWLALPAVASAHPLVERATALVLDGDYERARELLDEAWGRDDLSRDDLVGLLEARALLAHGAGDGAGLDHALRALASFAPTHRFGARFPPDLAARSVAIGRTMGGSLRVSTSTLPSPAGVRLEARTEHDAASIVRRLRYRVFEPARGEWREVTPPVDAAAGRELLVFVEAIGPGGAVVATAGSADAPLRVRGVGAEEAGAPAERAERDGGVSPWVIVGIVAAALAVIGVVIAVSVYAVENPIVTWQPTVPMER